MKLTELHASVKKKLDKILNINEVIIISNIPKQSLLDKGNMIILLGENKEALILEWIKKNEYHMDLKGVLEDKLIFDFLEDKQTTHIRNNIGILEHTIDYKLMNPILKSKLKSKLQSLEETIISRHTKFNNKFNKKSWLQSIQLHSGSFMEWCNEYGYDQLNEDVILKAMDIAKETNNHNLKKKAIISNYFI